MNVGLFGGTFNPPHRGHIAAAGAAREALGLDRLILMPAGLPPHKVLPSETPAPEHRLAMTTICAQALGGGAEAWDWELDGRVHYTADTLARLRAAFPEDALTLLVGADMFLTLTRWKRPEDIFALCRVGVFARRRGQNEALERHGEALTRDWGARIDIIPLEAVEISSSALRGVLASGGGEHYLAPEVWRYIRRHGLYGCS